MWKEAAPLFPESASTVSDSVDRLYLFLVATSGFFSLLIAGLVVFFAVRYRRSRHPRAVRIHGSTRLELLWTAIPLGLTMVMFGWGSVLYFDNVRPPADCMDVYVTGKQWMWKMQHPGGQREINDLHVPVGRPVRLTMISEDVIHSFFVPAFRLKRDVLPGRYTITWFQAEKPGAYHLFCAEYCGTKHSGMIGKVIAMEPRDYEAWLSGVPSGQSPEQVGQALFQSLRCDTCHAATSGARGPDLAGRFGRAVRLQSGETVVFDEDYARESILNPNARQAAGYEPIMPSYAGQLSEDQLLQIVAYLKSLEPEAEAGAEPGGN